MRRFQIRVDDHGDVLSIQVLVHHGFVRFGLLDYLLNFFWCVRFTVLLVVHRLLFVLFGISKCKSKSNEVRRCTCGTQNDKAGVPTTNSLEHDTVIYSFTHQGQGASHTY